jgi:pimeloyl-ACP methyl ester carboxylesterase
MTFDELSATKRVVAVGDARIAYCESGTGSAVVFLHGCPFASFIWRNVIGRLSSSFRCIAPDLLGLGDTETPASADWSLRAQAAAIIGLFDALSLPSVHIVGHDHGGAVAQILAAEHPERVKRLVLANVEAYDNWPSAEERPFVRLTQIPLIGDFVLWIWSWRPILRATLIEARAVHNREALNPEFLRAYVHANFASWRRRRKTRRFLAGQFDRRNNHVTLEIVEGLRRFDHPTLLIWGEDDPHFGPEWGERLQRDIPGVVRLERLPATGHLLMEERPAEFASLVRDFLIQAESEHADERTAHARI